MVSGGNMPNSFQNTGNKGGKTPPGDRGANAYALREGSKVKHKAGRKPPGHAPMMKSDGDGDETGRLGAAYG